MELKAPQRLPGRRSKLHVRDSEKPVSEWNGVLGMEGKARLAWWECRAVRGRGKGVDKEQREGQKVLQKPCRVSKRQIQVVLHLAKKHFLNRKRDPRRVLRKL